MDFAKHPRLRRRRVEKYLVFRFAIVLMALGLALIYQMGVEPDQKEPVFRYLYSLLGIHLLAGVVSLVGVARYGMRKWFAPVQVSIDFTIGALLTASTGGVISVFCPILFVSLFSACNVLGLRGALVFATLATLLLTATTLSYAMGLFPTRYLGLRWAFKEQQVNFVLTYMLAVAIALHVVAILGTQFSTGLLRAQNLQNEILENMCEGLVAVDNDGHILHVNGEARKIFDIDAESIPAGQTLEQVLTGPELEPVRRALSERRQWRSELDVRRGDGRIRPLEVKVASVEDEHGRLRCRVGLFADLGLKRDVEQAERRIHQLEELYQMSLGIAHEIRNPLASIRGCIQEVGRMQLDNPACTRLVEIVCKESDRLDHIIEEFMCYARKSSRPTSPIELRSIVEEAVVLLRNHVKYQDRQVELVAHDRDLVMLGDKEKVQQVVLNLGLNALASTAPGKGVVRVALTRRDFKPTPRAHESHETQPGIELVVEDNGIGIPSQNIDKIFTPFFTDKESGSGLGLAIVHRIVHDHGGMIRVESEEGRGTLFAISFPALVPTPRPGRSPKQAFEVPAEAPEIVS